MKWIVLITTLSVATAPGCSTDDDVSGVWQQEPCRQSPCDHRAKLHLGQFGDQIAGLVTWYRTRPNINTFDTPSYECGCDFIQVGSNDSETIAFATLPQKANCEEMPECNPCGCDNYEIRLSKTQADTLIGELVCSDGTFFPIELERALGVPKDQCANEVL